MNSPYSVQTLQKAMKRQVEEARLWDEAAKRNADNPTLSDSCKGCAKICRSHAQDLNKQIFARRPDGILTKQQRKQLLITAISEGNRKMENPLYTMMINNCAAMLKRKEEVKKIISETPAIDVPMDIDLEWHRLSHVNSFYLARGIAVGLAKLHEDVIADINAAFKK